MLKVCVDGRGQRPRTYFQGWSPPSHLSGQRNVDSVQARLVAVLPLLGSAAQLALLDSSFAFKFDSHKLRDITNNACAIAHV